MNDSLRDHLVALFHVAVADHADKTVEWALGSALTTNGKGVVLTMKNGKFSVAREIPAGEEAADARRQFTERILAR